MDRCQPGSLEGRGRPERGTSTLEWATYYDAADHAGISRLLGGHPHLRGRLRRPQARLDVRPRRLGACAQVLPRISARVSDRIGVGLLGYAFMGKAHSRAFHELLRLDPPLVPELVSIAGRDATQVEAARARYGWAEAVTDWREQVADERIGLFDNGGPNALHAEPTIAAARAANTSSARSRSGVTRRRRTPSGPRRRRRASCTCAASTTASCRRSGSRASCSKRASSASSSTSARATSSRGGSTPSRAGASRRRRPARVRSATSARTSSTWRATSSVSRSR